MTPHQPTVRQPSNGREVAAACTWLFVPGDRPDRFDKAQASGADQVICDLEDAVAPDQKDDARSSIESWLAGGGEAWVRVNGMETSWHERDIGTLVEQAGLRGFVVPKAEDPALLLELSRRLKNGCGLVALIETALGVHRAHNLAACTGVDRLAFGSIDFANDIDAYETNESLLYARSTLVLASRLANKPAPIDGVTTSLDDLAEISDAATAARRLGFGGKLCVHPAQLAVVAAAFQPSAEEIRWAREVLAGTTLVPEGASAVGGCMTDRAVLARAYRILEQSPPQPDRQP